MNNAIIGSVLKTLRERKKLTQAALAEKVKLSKDTLSRLERGKQSGAAFRTREALAKFLNVPLEVLTGEKPLPPEAEATADSLLDDRRYQLNIRVDGVVRNAFSLVAAHYGIPVARIVDVAPLLFVLAAEKSLEQRRQRLDDVNEALDRADTVAAGFHHLPNSIAPGFYANDSIAAEQESIARADILARKIDDNDKLFWGERRHKNDYEPEQDNPFICSLREAATDLVKAKINVFSRDDVDFRVCGADAMNLAGGDGKLAMGILDGWALVHEMPRDLLAESATEARVDWLKGKVAEQEAAWAALLAVEF
jgi:transcriptional regulator with XRE-family HTH domain